jgi:hypothetical protein
MTNYITKRIQVILRWPGSFQVFGVLDSGDLDSFQVFKGNLAYLVSGPKSTSGPTCPDFSWLPWHLLFFVEIMSDKVILNQKKSYMVYSSHIWSMKNFHFWWFFQLWPIFDKNRWNSQKIKIFKIDQIWLFMI